MAQHKIHRHLAISAICLIVATLALSLPALAQDAGTPDTVRYSPTSSTWTIDSYGETHSVDLWARCDDIHVFGATLGFKLSTSTGGGIGHDDSLIVVDTFLFSMYADFRSCKLSALDSASVPQSIHNQFDGYYLDVVNVWSGTLFSPGVATKIGTVKIRCLDPTQLSSSLDITVDSAFFPPSSEFAFAPSPGTPFPPQFTGATVHVTNTLAATAPLIGLDPTTIEFVATENEGDPPSQAVQISNIGTGILRWATWDDATWLNEWPPAGSGDATITLSVSTNGLTPGTYTALMGVSALYAGNSPQFVNVTLTVNDAVTVIQLNPTEIGFSGVVLGPNPPNQAFTITNGGEGLLEWTATDDADWLTCTPSSGLGNQNVMVSVDIAGLTPGIYGAIISVDDPSATNTPQKVTVTLDLQESPAVMALDRDFLYFEKVIGEPDPAAQPVAVSNVGGESLNWTASKTNDWLVLSDESGSAPSTVDVGVSGGPTSPGYFYDTIHLSSVEAINAPEMVVVMLSVHNAGTFPWGDADCTGEVDIDDVVYMIGYIFAGGPPPGDPDNDSVIDCP